MARRGSGIFENDAGGREAGSEIGGEDGTDAVALDDDAARRNVARVGEPGPHGDGVGGGEALGGMTPVAAPEAAVVEGKDVDSEIVQREESGNGVGERAAGIVEIEDGLRGVRGIGGSGHPPCVEVLVAGAGNVELDVVEGNAVAQGRVGEGAARMEKELPLALVEEEAEGAVSAEDGGEDGQEEGGEKPASADDRRGLGRRGRGAGLEWARGFAAHG